MAYIRMPPPSVEEMLDKFANWMAQHAQAKITVRIDYRDGTHQTTEIDLRGPRPKPAQTTVAVEVCPECDIAGCRHIRERMTPNMELRGASDSEHPSPTQG